MQGKTHLAVGAATALAILQPKTMPDLFVGAGMALIGSVISDIDVGTSESHEKADKVIAFSVLMIGALAVIEGIWHIGIIDRLTSNSSLARIILSAIVFLVLCAFGKEQPHRSFMHSFLALAALTGCISIILPPAAPYFWVGFLSHIAIDFLNRRGLQLFYPLPKRISLNLCSTTGIVDKTLRWLGTAAATGLFIYSLYRIGIR